jgi:ABC-type polysaccharide/polyol phosphate export permease
MMIGGGTRIGPIRTASPAEWARLQLQIVAALVKRDIQSRFGESWLAYAGSFLAPIAWIAATWLAFYLLGRTSPVYTDMVSFIISGLIPYALFRYVVTAVGRTKTTARGLLLVPSVAEEHNMAAGALVELANGVILFLLVAGANLAIFGKAELADPLAFAWGMLLCWGLGGAYAFFFAMVSRFHARAYNFGQLLLRPSFFLSAVFFTANELPEHILDWLSWNPLLHAIEVARDGMLFNYQSRIASDGYVLVWIAALGIGGAVLGLMRRN